MASLERLAVEANGQSALIFYPAPEAHGPDAVEAPSRAAELYSLCYELLNEYVKLPEDGVVEDATVVADFAEVCVFAGGLFSGRRTSSLATWWRARCGYPEAVAVCPALRLSAVCSPDAQSAVVPAGDQGLSLIRWPLVDSGCMRPPPPPAAVALCRCVVALPVAVCGVRVSRYGPLSRQSC